MTPGEAIAEATAGRLRPLYLLVGEDGYQRELVLSAIRAHLDTGPAAGFNTDKFIAGETAADAVINAARTAPMLAPRRLVVVTAVERWESGRKGRATVSLDEMASYAADPVPSAVMVLSASKLNGSRKLMRLAKAGDFLVGCKTLPQRQLPGWVRRRARELGHDIDPGLAELLSELVGPELATVADALERLSLFVGEGHRIDDEALAQVVTRVRRQTVWALMDCLSARNLGGALAALRDAYDPRDRGLPLLGAIGWRVRQLIKYQSALRGGEPPQQAAAAAGVAPFKAADLDRTVHALSRRKLESWLLLLAEADLALKGSRRRPAEVLASTVVAMCD